jgi:hypothetical protein
MTDPFLSLEATPARIPSRTSVKCLLRSEIEAMSRARNCTSARECADSIHGRAGELLEYRGVHDDRADPRPEFTRNPSSAASGARCCQLKVGVGSAPRAAPTCRSNELILLRGPSASLLGARSSWLGSEQAPRVIERCRVDRARRAPATRAGSLAVRGDRGRTSAASSSWRRADPGTRTHRCVGQPMSRRSTAGSSRAGDNQPSLTSARLEDPPQVHA